MRTTFALIGPFLFSFCLLGLMHGLDWLERWLIADDGAGSEVRLLVRSSAR